MNSQAVQEAQETRFALCLRNEGYPASLEVSKVYPLLPTTPEERQRGLVRVVDESGEDYLYPGDYFLVIELPVEAREALLKAA